MAVCQIGLEKLDEFFRLFRFNTDPIVSVGSGECGLETYLESHCLVDRECCWVCSQIGKHKCSRCKIRRYCSTECQRSDWPRHKSECIKDGAKIICVDPNPGSYPNDNRLFLKTRDPNYPLVDDLIRERKSLVRNCNLILNWPSPNNQGNSYDIKAIKALTPKVIFLMFESSGSSGSPDLIAWIANEVENDKVKGGTDNYGGLFILPSGDGEHYPDRKYRAIACHTHIKRTKYDRFFYKYLILVREDQEMGEFEPIIEKTESFKDEDNDCSVM